MFTEALALAPALIGLTVFGTLGILFLIVSLTRPEPLRTNGRIHQRR